MTQAQKVNAPSNDRDSITHELIPYACHYSPETLLTKNGELIQIIKLEDSGGINDHDFRQLLKDSLKQAIDPAKFAVWIHTIRQQKEVKAFDADDFGQYVDYLWRQHLPTEIHFVNEIYISVVIDSVAFEPWKLNSFLRSLSKKKEEEYFNQQLAARHASLTKTADKIIGLLAGHGAQKLSIYSHSSGYCSEPMEFIKRIIGADYQPMPLPLCDLSLNLKPQSIEFNTYTGTILLNDGARKFGKMLTLKESIGINAPALQNLLNADVEFIITESADFAYSNRFLPAVKEQGYFNKISLDKNLAESTKLGLANNQKGSDLILQQTNISVFAPSQAKLDEAINKIADKLQFLGIVAFVEDINCERAYWSALPANFKFLKRQDSTLSNNLANFACFGVDKYSSVEDCLFGKPVTFFETADASVFALHFLSNGLGHILIAGTDEATKQCLANLIATQTANAGAGVIFYDHSKNYANFAQNIGAEYIDVLDLDIIAQKLDGSPKIIVLSSIAAILASGAQSTLTKFIEFAGSQNCIVVCLADYADNCELILQSFTLTAFLPCKNVTEQFADNYDIFEDEIKIIEFLNPDQIHIRYGYDEMTLKFAPSDTLKKALLEGILP